MTVKNSGHSSLPTLGIAVIALSVVVLSCASPKIGLTPGTQPTFRLSGPNHVILFQVSGPENRIWKLYPKGNSVPLDNLGEIRYGEVPPNCEQAEPKTGPAPALIEGGAYVAVAVIFDAEPVRVYFVIKDGKAVPSADKPRGSN